MKKRNFETYHKRFREVEILAKFSESHVFQGTIRHPWDSFSFYMRTIQSGTGTKITRVGLTTDTKSDRWVRFQAGPM